MLQKITSFLTVSIVVLSLLLTSCSSIINGSMSDMSISSDPSDAIIKVNGMDAGRTPTTIRLKRGETHIIEIKKAGFTDYKIVTTKSIAGWVWGNLICGGILGFVIDFVTGNAYDVEPRVVNAKLSKDIGLLNETNSTNAGTNNADAYVIGEFETIKLVDANNNVIGNVKITWE